MTLVYCYIRDRAWFVRMYGEINPGLSRVEYRPYRRSNHALSYLYLDVRVEHVRYEVETCIWGPFYNSRLCATGIKVICAAGKNINPRFRIKINASYIVSTEELPHWLLKQPKYAYIQYFI